MCVKNPHKDSLFKNESKLQINFTFVVIVDLFKQYYFSCSEVVVIFLIWLSWIQKFANIIE